MDAAVHAKFNPELVIFGQRRAAKLENCIMLLERQYIMKMKLYDEALPAYGLGKSTTAA